MTEARLDEIDKSIVAHLARDARTSNRQIATELGVTEGTVRARIKRMEEQNAILISGAIPGPKNGLVELKKKK